MDAIAKKPPVEEYPAYYQGYMDQIPDSALLAILNQNLDDFNEFLIAYPDKEGLFRYDTGKWSVKEVINHVMDAERIFAFRALSFARNEKDALQFYDHIAYAEEAKLDHLNLKAVQEEFNALRRSTISLFNNMTDEALRRIGYVGELPMSARAAGYIIAAHGQNHLNVLRDKYI